MDEARIGVFEDNVTWQRLFVRTLEGHGHRVVVRAASRAGATALTPPSGAATCS